MVETKQDLDGITEGSRGPQPPADEQRHAVRRSRYVEAVDLKSTRLILGFLSNDFFVIGLPLK